MKSKMFLKMLSAISIFAALSAKADFSCKSEDGLKVLQVQGLYPHCIKCNSATLDDGQEKIHFFIKVLSQEESTYFSKYEFQLYNSDKNASLSISKFVSTGRGGCGRAGCNNDLPQHVTILGKLTDGEVQTDFVCNETQH